MIRRPAWLSAVCHLPTDNRGALELPMSKTFFTKDHEYVVVEGDVGVVGITDFAQHQLGDVVFIDLPELGRINVSGKEASVVESVKAASDVFAPVSGEVVEINADLIENPALINEDAQGKGWLYKVRIAAPAELDELLDEAVTRNFVATMS
jgi:glycine cleavage system H protein